MTEQRPDFPYAPAPSVAVVIPAFNAQAFIGRALESALGQEGVTLEVLVIDDHSSDGTVETVAAWEKKDPRVRLLRLPVNQGPSAARNLGIRQARSHWVAVLDADDAYLPGRLETMLDLARVQGADIVADNFRYYDPIQAREGRPALQISEAWEALDLTAYIDRCRPFRPESDYGLLKPVFRRAFLVEHGLSYREDIRHGEDFALAFEALRRGARYIVCRQPMYLYTKRSSGMSRTRVNYSEAMDHARSAQLQARAVGAYDVARRLAARVKALAHLEARANLMRSMADRDYLGMARLALGSRQGVAQAALLGAGTLRRRVSRFLGGRTGQEMSEAP